MAATALQLWDIYTRACEKVYLSGTVGEFEFTRDNMKINALVDIPCFAGENRPMFALVE